MPTLTALIHKWTDIPYEELVRMRKEAEEEARQEIERIERMSKEEAVEELERLTERGESDAIHMD